MMAGAVAKAAEQLARAALEQADCQSLEVARESLQLEKDAVAELKSVKAAIAAQAAEVAKQGAMLEKLTGAVAALALEMQFQQTTIATHLAAIAAAARATSIERVRDIYRAGKVGDSFKYEDGSGTLQGSNQLVMRLCGFFMTGTGGYITGFSTKADFLAPTSYYDSHQRVDVSKKPAAAEAFRNEIVSELHGLLGLKPVVKQEADGRYAIYLP